MQLDYSLIQRAIDGAVTANMGKAFINANTVFRSQNVRAALEVLAVACGVQSPRQYDISSEHLAMMYATARKDMGRAAAMAANWNDEQSPPASGANPLLDESPPVVAAIDVEAVIEAVRKEASAIAEYVARDRLAETASVVWDSRATKYLADISQETRAAVHSELALLESAVDARVSAAIAAMAPTKLTVTLPDTSEVSLGVVHYMQERLIRVLGARCNVYLYGPAGSGKTTAGRKCADAFKLPFYFTGKIDSEYLLLGFNNAQGETVRTQFREAYEKGGVFLFDEIDRSAPSAFTALNAALANGICAFPDGIVQMHPDFKCIAAGNTRMSGADNTYTAGQQQDASSIDRFAFIHWGYDETLELALASDKAWARLVQAVRAQCEARGINHLVTPRATIDGCKLLACGDSWDDAASAVLWKGLDDSTVAQLRAATSDNWGLI